MSLFVVQPSLPAEPLVALVDGAGGPAAFGLAGPCHLRRAYARAKTRGRITYDYADRFSVVVLGMHPYEVWGDAWWASTDNPQGCPSIDSQGAHETVRS